MTEQSDSRLSGFLADRLPKMSFILGAIGLLFSVIFYFQDSHHFFFSYIVSFTFFLCISLGALFFVLIQFITRAGWSVLVRRVAEVIMQNIGLMALFFLPILLGLHDLYHWTHADAVATDHILQGKVPYLNVPFFIVRAILFFGIWIYLARRFFSLSVAQDSSGDKGITVYLQKLATGGIFLFAITQTFAFVDWIMSLTPHWYSTMFGVYFFAISCVLFYSFFTTVLLVLRRYGFLKDLVTVEHYHDLGKLLFGFNVFWAYITFSQYFLVWYSNIPEETIWFYEHFMGSWNTVAIFLAVGHFGLPFILFMTRHAKRNLTIHLGVALWFMIVSFIEIYWVVMPTIIPKGFEISVMDLMPFVGILGIFVGCVFRRLSRQSLYPTQDPRLEESRRFENF